MSSIDARKKEVLSIYKRYWETYLEGDIDAFSEMLDENCQIIGSSRNEEFNDKTSALAFYRATADQVSGPKLKIRFHFPQMLNFRLRFFFSG